MKSLLLLALAMTSFQAFAFSSITLKSESKLTLKESSRILSFNATAGKGNDYCNVFLISAENVDSLIVPAGTVFEVIDVRNVCGNDSGRVCRLDISAFNQEMNVNLNLVCKDKGLLAMKLSELKVNTIAKDLISVK